MAAASNSLYCAIDFGTTYSGFCFGREGDEGHMEEAWEGAGNSKPYCKTPTVLTITNGDLSNWGWEAINEHTNAKKKDVAQGRCILVEQFKLFLSPDEPDMPDLPDHLEPWDLIVFFLTKLSDYAVKRMNKAYNTQIEKKDVVFAMTVPAIWEAAAKQSMIDFCEAAGMSNISILLEPEAASMCACADKSLPADDAVVVVADLGGGTADLVTHQVFKGGREVREVCIGNGGLCGGKHVDLAFLKYMRNRLEPHYAQFEATKPADAINLRRSFEFKKMSFGSRTAAQRKPIELQLPGVLTKMLLSAQVFKDEDDGELFAISYKDCVDIFKPVLDKIITLITQQLDWAKANGKPATHLLLVGGLSASVHVQHVLRTHFERHLTVAVPSNPGAAVVHGAYTSMSLTTGPHVLERISRNSYGVLTNMLFDPAVHDSRHKYQHTEEKVDYADNVFDLFVAANEGISPTHSVVKKYAPTFSGAPLAFRLFTSPHPNPVHTDRHHAKEIGQMTVHAGQGSYVEVTMKFQQELITVTAVNSEGHRVKVEVNFEPIRTNLAGNEGLHSHA